MDSNEKKEFLIRGVIFLMVFVLILFSMWIFPIYTVWQKGQAGEAELRQAEWNRQISVKEALAKLEASKSLASAEIERAKGVAEANKIIGQSLHENEDYLRYLWIVDVASAGTDKTVIYIPTETNLPILEASRWSK